MLDTTEAVADALRANDARPYGRQRTVAAEEITEAAEQFEDRPLLIAALLDLMEAYTYDSEPRKSPVVFARVLKLWDQHPEEFNDWARQQVFWRFKWVASALRSVPDMPLAAVRRWHVEMRDRYRAAGYGLQPYYALEFHLASHTGVDADAAFDLWAGRPRGELSDCVACETHSRAAHHVRGGDDARALEVWQPVLEGRSSCSEEPYASHASALLPLLRQGRTDEARSSHLVGYRFARGRTHMVASVGEHLEFCALSGNEARGLEILAENRDLFDVTGNPLAMVQFLTGVEVLLAVLATAGHAGIAVSGPPGSSWTVATLLAEVRTRADELAARFDARNGTDAVSARRRARLAQQPLLAQPLALGVRATALPGTDPGQNPAPLPRPAAEPVPEDLTALVPRARELRLLSHPDADRLWLRVAELVSADGYAHPEDPELGSLDRILAELAEERAFDVLESGDHARARAELASAAELFERAGMPGRALAERARSGVWGINQDRKAADWPVLDELMRQAEELRASETGMTDNDYLAVRQCRLFAAHHELSAAGSEPSTELTERFAVEAELHLRTSLELGFSHRAAISWVHRADLAARQGRFEEAESELNQAEELILASETPWGLPPVVFLRAQIRLRRREFTEAMGLFQQSLAEATRWGLSSFPYGPAYAMLGQSCAHSGDPAGAARALSEAAARFDRNPDPNQAAETRLQLASQLDQAGRTADAVAVLESVLLAPAAAHTPAAADTPAATLHERLRAQIRLTLARGLVKLGEHRDAAEEYLTLADAVADWEDQDTHTMVACEAAVTLAQAGSWDAARAARERALASHARAPRPDQVAAVLREFARRTMEVEGPAGLESALAQLDQADAVRERAVAQGQSVQAEFLASGVHYERARCYASAERPEEGLAWAERAVAGYGQAGLEAARAEAVRVAAVIEGGTLGRREAARARLAEAVARCERAGLGEAAKTLAALRDRFGEAPA
jgi:tetratricopeptide (TPR) repeat protein